MEFYFEFGNFNHLKEMRRAETPDIEFSSGKVPRNYNIK